jgi:clan AA aspartic protease (TIGR02281 family)
MAMNRLFVVLLASVLWMLACSSSSALDVGAPASENRASGNREWGEATDFFNRLSRTSSNPIIVNMARENLQRLYDPVNRSIAAVWALPRPELFPAPDPLQPSPHKTLTEIKLVPQPDNTYVVPAVVNHRHTATFLVDTGASYTVITPKMARQLGLRFEDDSTTVPVTTANGVVHAPLIRLKQLTLGTLKVENVEAVVADLGDVSPISGLLGMSFFHGMELSFKQDRLIIGR